MAFRLTLQLLEPLMNCCLGRRDDYAVQGADGRYLRQGQPLTSEVMAAHLAGTFTIGTYVIDEQGWCRFAVFDSDTPAGLFGLAVLQARLRGLGIPCYLEVSRRGGHLWLFFEGLRRPAEVRALFLPLCPPGVEFYPKQDELSPDRPYGALVRVPLGTHRLTGRRYPFVEVCGGEVRPLFATLSQALAWFASVELVRGWGNLSGVPTLTGAGNDLGAQRRRGIPFLAGSGGVSSSIKDWCLAQDPIEVIGRYVGLDEHGMGCCPFGWHHDDGVDSHASLWVYRPVAPDVCCWYCHVWQAGGSLFDFLRYYYGLSPRELWQRIQAGGVY